MIALLVLGLVILVVAALANPPRPRGYQPRATGKVRGAPPPGPSAGHNAGRRA